MTYCAAIASNTVKLKVALMRLKLSVILLSIGYAKGIITYTTSLMAYP